MEPDLALGSVARYRVFPRVDWPAFFLLLAFAINTVSASHVTHAESGTLYWSKHFAIALMASVLLALAFLVASISGKIRISEDAVLLLLSVTPYLLRGSMGIVLFLQAAVVVAASLYARRAWESRTIFRWRWGFALAAAVPFFIDLLADHGNFIYNSYYGRSRLLLGYWHPKEAGIAILFVLMIFRLRSDSSFSKFDLFAIALLWFIQSRNGMLFYLNFLLINWLLSRLSLAKVCSVLFVLDVCFPAMLFFAAQRWLNIVSSERLSFWFSASDLFSRSTDFDISSAAPGAELIHVDNFYLEYYFVAGALSLLLLLIVISYLVGRVSREKIGVAYKNAIFIPFLFYCFFDSGLFSTGNFLNIFVFSFFLARPSRVVDP